MKLLVDEMYPATLGAGPHATGIEATAVAALQLARSSDADVFGAAVQGWVARGAR